MILGADGLCTILYHRNLMVLCDGQNRIQVRGLTKQVHWNNRLDFLAAPKRLLQTLGANVVRGGINVNHDRPRAQAGAGLQDRRAVSGDQARADRGADQFKQRPALVPCVRQEDQSEAGVGAEAIVGRCRARSLRRLQGREAPK